MSTNFFDVPILFLIYRNPEVTRTTFEQIRKIRPSHLYIAADGPHLDRPLEIDECELTRHVVDLIDWDCEVKKRFLPENVGLKKAVSGAIDWFFSEVDEGIILEYDCLAGSDFFNYCKEMLSRYRDDKDVFSISGNNLQNGIWRGDGDYYYSHLFGCWGWATWKRAWQHWQPNLPNYERFVLDNQIANFVISNKARKSCTQSLDDIYHGRNTTTWAFCFEYAQMCQCGLCIVPNRNLVSNIGFSKEGTHAKDPNHPLANMPTESLASFRAPTFKIANIEADELQTINAYRASMRTEIRIVLGNVVKFILPEFMIQYIRNMRAS
jgi:hypothetical protein